MSTPYEPVDLNAVAKMLQDAEGAPLGRAIRRDAWAMVHELRELREQDVVPQEDGPIACAVCGRNQLAAAHHESGLPDAHEWRGDGPVGHWGGKRLKTEDGR